jgi:hypothetical protein
MNGHNQILVKQIAQLFGLIMGRTGWSLLMLIALSIVLAPMYLPFAANLAGLSTPKAWPAITLSVVWLTVGAWIGTLLASIARVVVWLRLKFAMTEGKKWTREKEDVVAVQSLSLWLLGLLTVLSVYLTQWFTGS